MAVENDVFKMRPVPPEVRDALLAAVDALALHAVISLNEAHGLLVNAGAVIGPPPSDQWYRLIEQLTERQDVVGRNQQERRLCVGAAAFLAAEAHHLEDHCAALSDDAGQTVVQERVQKIADQVRDAVDGLLTHAEHLEQCTIPAPWPLSTGISRISVESGGRSARPWFLSAALVALVVIYGIVGKSITAFSHPKSVIVLLFVIVPILLTLTWYLQARHPHFISFLRTPRRAAEWSDEVTRHSIILDVRAAALRDLLRRIHLVASNVAAEQRVCENHELFIAASKLTSLSRQLQDASTSTENLAELVTAGSEEARGFTASCRRDPREASSEYVRLPLVLDPERIEAVTDNLILVLRLTVEVALDIPLHIQGEELRISTVPAGKIATEVGSIFGEFQGSSRSLKRECHSLLRAFDSLHCLVTTESLATLDLGHATRMTAQAAVAASVLTQSTARRPAVRTAFMREASASSNRSWVWIGKATVAAITRGQKSRVQ
jgi:hypothetical protein